MDLVEMFLEGKADVWYQGFKANKKQVSWELFIEELCKRFSGLGQPDTVEDFANYNRFPQQLLIKRSLKNYYQKLCNEPFSLRILHEKIKSMVKMHKPTALSEALKKMLMNPMLRNIGIILLRNIGIILRAWLLHLVLVGVIPRLTKENPPTTLLCYGNLVQIKL